ncbi:MAG: amino acid ABC transporter ATP-binding protein [Erysipelotrichaceae bacterium]|nr:amino acid ABC transporter ATP-binding protein [Erysipelotrichaceae bacterium]
MIEVKNLQKTYKTAPVIKGISTTIKEGDIIAIIGPSGCGKSTFIRCLNMLEKPSGGQIILDGVDISAPDYDKSKISRKMGMVFQTFNLFNHLTVIENIMRPQMSILKRDKQSAYDKAQRLLSQVNLQARAFSYPSSLSGGQKQRTAIARTLAMDPEIILFDEPTSALDPTMVGEVKSVISHLAKSGKTMIIVTHDMDFARNIASRIFYIDEGTIYEEGTSDEIFNHPKKEKTKQFIHNLKVQEFLINDRKFDFFDARTAIEEYCQKNQISYTKTYHLQSIFEELCIEILLPLLEDEIAIRFIIEYAENKDALSATVLYGRKKMKIEGTQNKLSMDIVEGFQNPSNIQNIPANIAISFISRSNKRIIFSNRNDHKIRKNTDIIFPISVFLFMTF